MNATAWVNAASGLTGALIGAAAALIGAYLEARRRQRSTDALEHRAAVEEVLVRSQSIELRVQQAVLMSANVGSLTGLLNRALNNLAPLDLQGLFDRLDAEANGLQRAASRVWLSADVDTIALTNQVVLAAMDVVDAHSSPAGPTVATMFKIAATGRFSSDRERIRASRTELASARRALVEHARLKLSLPYVDLFAATPTNGPQTNNS